MILVCIYMYIQTHICYMHIYLYVDNGKKQLAAARPRGRPLGYRIHPGHH